MSRNGIEFDALFSMLDTDGSGYITPPQLEYGLSTIINLQLEPHNFMKVSTVYFVMAHLTAFIQTFK